MNNLPRPEYPRPQFERATWQNLNGEWSYTFDFGKSGMDLGRELFRSHGFPNRIIVPFCPESKLSGVQHTDFIEALWYHRELQVPGDWMGKRVLLHFGAVDYESEVFIDGKSVGLHFGGVSAFTWDITQFVKPGSPHHLVVRVADELRSGRQQPCGKQSSQFKSAVCHYTRTTGIWQTVWLEAVDPGGLRDVQIIPDLDGGRLIFVPAFQTESQGRRFKVTASTGETVTAPAVGGVPVSLPLRELRPWSPASPYLYDLEFSVIDKGGRELDQVHSYAGLRKIHIEGNRVFLNNEPIYQRLVLDQGFYPDGIWTAPTDAALRRDIELSQQAGFNGARLHQKVFEPRFHYWADRLGYLTWGAAPRRGAAIRIRLKGPAIFSASGPRYSSGTGTIPRSSPGRRGTRPATGRSPASTPASTAIRTGSARRLIRRGRSTTRVVIFMSKPICGRCTRTSRIRPSYRSN